jgi:hypothetical protein
VGRPLLTSASAAARDRRARRWRFPATLALVSFCFLAVISFGAAAAHSATAPCREVETTQPAPEDATNLIELQPNALEPTFSVQLDDSTAGEDDISFQPQGRQRPGTDADVAAEFIDQPRYKGHRLGGDQAIAAHASKSGRSIVLYVCLDNVPQYAAGRYEGSVALYGPKLADFTYAIVVTTKWPSWTAWTIIGLTIVGALLIGFLTGTFSFPSAWRNWKGWIRLVLAVVFAVAFALLPYWSVYASNETWGSTPASDLTALVAATFAAAAGGLALANKLLSA